MKKQLFYLSICILFLWTQHLNAQFQSNFHEHDLIYGKMIQTENYFYDIDYKDPVKFTIVLPSLSFNLLSPDLKYGDIYNAEKKSLDLASASDSRKDFNLCLNSRMSYGGLKYNLNKFSISFFHEWTSDLTLKLPNQLFEVVTKGNANLTNSDFNINPSAVFQNIHKWSLGFDLNIERFTSGVQFHLLLGDAFFDTNNSNINIEIDDNFFELAFDKSVDVKTSGTIDYHAIDSVDLILKDHAFSPMGSFKNKGFGISAQFKYRINESSRIFGRIEDIGFVKWEKESLRLQDDSYKEFSGFDVRGSYVSGETYSIEDTLKALINIQKNQESFSSTLMSSFMLGAQYDLNEWITLGGVIRTKSDGFNQMYFIEPQVIFKPINNLSFAISNIYTSSSPLNIRLVMRSEIAQRFGMNLNLVNPWAIGKYYDTKMIYSSLGFYLNI